MKAVQGRTGSRVHLASGAHALEDARALCGARVKVRRVWDSAVWPFADDLGPRCEACAAAFRRAFHERAGIMRERGEARNA